MLNLFKQLTTYSYQICKANSNDTLVWVISFISFRDRLCCHGIVRTHEYVGLVNVTKIEYDL